MSLIICPECGKTVSNRATQCIYCGCPLDNMIIYPTEGFTLIESTQIGDTKIHCNKCNNILTFDNTHFLLIYKERVVLKNPIQCPYCLSRQENGNITLTEQELLAIKLKESKEWDERARKIQTSKLPTCPRCGSTSVTTGARGVSGFWGFIGASKTVNRCANCGHTWTPRG